MNSIALCEGRIDFQDRLNLKCLRSPFILGPPLNPGTPNSPKFVPCMVYSIPQSRYCFGIGALGSEKLYHHVE